MNIKVQVYYGSCIWWFLMKTRSTRRCGEVSKSLYIDFFETRHTRALESRLDPYSLVQLCERDKNSYTGAMSYRLSVRASVRPIQESLKTGSLRLFYVPLPASGYNRNRLCPHFLIIFVLFEVRCPNLHSICKKYIFGAKIIFYSDLDLLKLRLFLVASPRKSLINPNYLCWRTL